MQKFDSKANTNPDPSLRDHLQVLMSSTKIYNRILYSLRCIYSSLEFTNINYQNNLYFMSGNISVILGIFKSESIKQMEVAQLSFKILNLLLPFSRITENDLLRIIKAVGQIRIEKNKYLSDTLINELIISTKYLTNDFKTNQQILQIMTAKLSPDQIITMFEQLKYRQLQSCEVRNLIAIASKHNNNQKIITKILYSLQWQICNIISYEKYPNKAQAAQEIFRFISYTVKNNICKFQIIYLTALIYRELTENKKIVNGISKIISKNLDTYLRMLITVKQVKLYLPNEDKFIKEFSQIVAILEQPIEILKNQSYFHILYFYAKNKFPWRSQLIAYKQKIKTSQILKQFLLRATQNFEDTSKNGRKTNISEEDEKKYSSYLPVEAFRSIKGLIQKLSKSQSAHFCVETIKIINFLSPKDPEFIDLLHLIHKISLQCKQYDSLKQIEKVICQNYSSRDIISQLKEKNTFKNVKYNQDNKRYFSWIPLFCSKNQIENQIQNQVGNFFGYENVSIQMKFYVAEYLCKKMVKEPIKKFINYLIRQLQNIINRQVYLEMKYYLKKNAENKNQAISDWCFKHFTEEIERLLEIVFSKLINSNLKEIPDLIFLLQKYNVYGNSWTHSYRWSLSSLESAIQLYNKDYTLDCLEIFEMLVEKIETNKISQNVIRKYEKIIKKGWGKFSSKHMFAIQRINAILQTHSMLNFSLKQLEPAEIIEAKQKQYDVNRVLTQLDNNPTTKFINWTVYNIFFGHLDAQKGLRSIIEKKKYYATLKQSVGSTVINSVITINCIIWSLENSESTGNQYYDQFIMARLFDNTGSYCNNLNTFMDVIRVTQELDICLEFLSRVPHKINILKLPMNQIFLRNLDKVQNIQDICNIISIVTEQKPQAISIYKLSQTIKSCIITLISLQDQKLITAYINFLETVCFNECQYTPILQDMLIVFEKGLDIERYGMPYRPELVDFLLDTLIYYEYQINQAIVWFLLRKYCEDEKIVTQLLGYFKTGNQTIKNSPSKDERLLLRLLMIHNQNSKILQQCRQIFNKQIPQSSSEQQFLKEFKNLQYTKCQSLIPKIINPYSIKLDVLEIRNCFEWNRFGDECKKLMRFLFDNPETKQKIYECENFFLQEQYISFIEEILQNIEQEAVVKSFDLNKDKFGDIKACLSLEKQLSKTIIYKTISKIILNRTNSLKLKGVLLELFKKQTEKFQTLLKFYIKVISNYPFNSTSSDQIIVLADFFKSIISAIELTNITPNLQELNPYLCDELIYVFPLTLPSFEKKSQNHEDESHQIMQNIFKHLIGIFKKFNQIRDRELDKLRYINKVLAFILFKINKNPKLYFSYVSNFFLKLEHQYQFNYEKQTKVTSEKKQFTYLINEIFNQMVVYYSQLTEDGNFKPKLINFEGFLAFVLYMINHNYLIYDIILDNLLQTTSKNLANYFNQASEKDKAILKESIDWIINKVDKLKKTAKNGNKIESSTVNQKATLNPIKSNISGDLTVDKRQTYGNEPSQISKQQDMEKQLLEQKYSTKKMQSNEDEARKEIEQSYIKYRQIEENITVTENIVNNKTTILVIDANNSTNLFSEDVEPPKEQNFNEEAFFNEKQEVKKPQYIEISEERKANINNASRIDPADQSIHSLKDHIKYITTILEFNDLTDQEHAQVFKSLESITETVLSHHFYCKKVIDMNFMSDLISLYKKYYKEKKSSESKGIDKKVIEIQKERLNTLVKYILNLCIAIAEKKEKKLICFNDEESIQFFKMIIKMSLNENKQLEFNKSIILIMIHCKGNIEVFYKYGLISMIIELANRSISELQIIDYFINIDLSMHIINQIYQRGLFNRMVNTFQQKTIALDQPKFKLKLNLWVKLAGKVCINNSIQAKYMSKKLHINLFEKFSILNQPEDRLNIAYFYAYLCLKNEAISQWLKENKVIEELFNSLKNLPLNDELYLLFYHFCFNSPNNRDYSFRIKYHLHLIEKVNLKHKQIANQSDTKQSVNLSKYFYKSLGQMMNNKLYAQVFLKDEIVKKLMAIFESKHESSIYECFLDFISILETDAQFDQLKKQQFWNSLKIFEYKISNEAIYSYILQIFLIMIKKGRTKEFNHTQVRTKTCLKAEYSINMQGKQLALRFIIALSIRNKENYLTQRCVRLLSSIMSLKVSKNQLFLTQQMLKIQGSTKNLDFLKFFNEYEICSMISDSFDKLSNEELQLAFNILFLLSHNQKNSNTICHKCLPSLAKILQTTEIDQIFINGLKLLNKLSISKQNKALFDLINIDDLLSFKIENKIKDKNLSSLKEQIVQNLSKNMVYGNQNKRLLQIASLNNQGIILERTPASSLSLNKKQVNQKSLKILSQGKKVKMYKADGSISQLLLFLSSDQLELNCATKRNEPIKQKWRLPLNQINKSVIYQGQETPDFMNSLFEKNSGIFTKAPPFDCCLTLNGKNNDFNINFSSAAERNEWMGYITDAKDHVSIILNKLK